jgi:hypothetical protein
MTNAYRIEIGKPKGKRPDFRKKSIRIDLKEIQYESVDWIYFSLDMVGYCEHDNESSGPIKRGEFLAPSSASISFSRRILQFDNSLY